MEEETVSKCLNDNEEMKEETVSKCLKDNEEDSEKNAGPAEYLFKNTKYHDCHLKVGDPNTGEVEVIGVVTSSLVAHSSVFRHMLVDSDLADPTGANTHITDVRPEVFRLMLKHMYGGRLNEMDGISKHTILELALCADKYNVQPLVREARCLLTPANVEDVLLALQRVLHINNNIFEDYVIRIIQEQTDKVVGSKQFLTLDPNALEFIAKQDKLSITELELWQSLVQWAKSQDLSEVGARQLLTKPLRHVRLATLTRDQIIDHVVPDNVLTTSEVMNLLKGSSDDQSLAAIGLSVIREKRGFCEVKSTFGAVATEKSQDEHKFKFIFEEENISGLKFNGESSRLWSILRLKTGGKMIQVESITFISDIVYDYETDPVFELNCILSVYIDENGFTSEKAIVTKTGKVVSDDDIIFPLRLVNGQPVTLDANTVYRITLEFSTPQPAYRVDDSAVYFHSVNGHFQLKYLTPAHVRKIAYRIYSS